MFTRRGWKFIAILSAWLCACTGGSVLSKPAADGGADSDGSTVPPTDSAVAPMDSSVPPADSAMPPTDSSVAADANGDSDAGETQVTWSTTPGRALPDTLYGVTTESVDNLSSLADAIGRHSRHVTTRIVLQDGEDASSYATAVSTLRGKGYVMGEILDSTGLADMSVNNYRARARDFVGQFGNSIDLWEIGNELNGEWVGKPADINAKVQAAYDVVEKEHAADHLRSAVTLNYWPSSDCYSNNWEATLTFAQQMPEEVRNGTDYLLLSFYETACSPRAMPSVNDVASMFNSLASIFPNAKLGFGEIGAQGADDGFPNPNLAEKQAIANRYYGMHNQLKTLIGSRYIGGYFWWYYAQDAVPYNKPNSLWPTLDTLFLAY